MIRGPTKWEPGTSRFRVNPDPRGSTTGVRNECNRGPRARESHRQAAMCSLLRVGRELGDTACSALTGRGSMTRSIAFAAAALLVFGSSAATAEGQSGTLATVKQRGLLNCGVNSALAGFSQSDGKGNWQGFDVDYCKAIAAAVLADPAKVNYIPVPRAERFSSLQSGDIDVLVRNTTWTSTRDSSSGMSFVAVTYYDGQGFMVKASRGIK